VNKMFCMTALAAAALIGAVGSNAQAAPAGAAPAAAKVGVLNVQAAIASTAEGKQASAELQSQFASRQTELETLNKQIDDLRKRLQAGAKHVSQEEQARLTRQGEGLAKQAQRKQRGIQRGCPGSARRMCASASAAKCSTFWIAMPVKTAIAPSSTLLPRPK